ncbi:MAG: universal stress protein, partial [Verrucomicrobiales bacterium]
DDVSDGCPHDSHVYSEFSLRRGIVDYLKSSSPDLVVINTRGHTQIRNLLIGSAAEKIIHEADCSTLVIKPHGFRYDLD